MALLLVGIIALTGCIPEANRERGGGPGGDIGNRPDTVQMHGEHDAIDRIYYETPTMGRGIEVDRNARDDDADA